MSSTVTLPLWIVVVLSALAIVALLDRLLVPSVRWALRRRANRAIDKMNTRLRLQIQPFKLTRRQVLIDQLVYDPEVLHAVEQYAKEKNVPREVAADRVKRYAREIVPSFSAYAYFGIGARLARWISTALYRVRLGYMDEGALKTVDPDKLKGDSVEDASGVAIGTVFDVRLARDGTPSEVMIELNDGHDIRVSEGALRYNPTDKILLTNLDPEQLQQASAAGADEGPTNAMSSRSSHDLGSSHVAYPSEPSGK